MPAGMPAEMRANRLKGAHVGWMAGTFPFRTASDLQYTIIYFRYVLVGLSMMINIKEHTTGNASCE